MTDLDPQLDAVAAATGGDLAPLLAYADWLAQHGDPDRAEFIRLLCGPVASGSSPSPRVKELFDTHGPRWFAPAYEMLRTTATTRPDADRAAVDAAVHGAMGVMAAASGVVGPPAQLPPDPFEAEKVPVPVIADITRWGVTLRADWIDFARRHPGSFGLQQNIKLLQASMVQVMRGVATHVSLGEPSPQRIAACVDLLTREPVTQLTLTLPPIPPHWRRLNGPHLRRVRHFNLNLTPMTAADEFDSLAAAVFTSPHLSAVTELDLNAGWQVAAPSGLGTQVTWTHACTAGVLEQLTASPLWRRLTSLRLTSGGTGWLSDLPALADAPTDTRLESLAVMCTDVLGEPHAPLLDVAETLSRLSTGPQLKAVQLDGLPLGANGVERLLKGNDWSRVERLTLSGAGLGDAGAKALAAVAPTTLPALRSLTLSGNGIGNSGAVALAESPLARQLHTLDLSQNRVGNAGAEALAARLNEGELRTLNLTVIGMLDVPMLPFGKERWMWKVLRWMTFPILLPLLLLGRLAGGRRMRQMPLTASVSSAVRGRLKEKYGSRILFGDEWRNRTAGGAHS